MTARSIELSHLWMTWHHTQWAHHLRLMLLYRGQAHFEAAARAEQDAEWSVLAARAHERFLREVGRP